MRNYTAPYRKVIKPTSANDITRVGKLSSSNETDSDSKTNIFDSMINVGEIGKNVLEAVAAPAKALASKPGKFNDPYKDQYMDYLNQYENRDPFSYDLNSDAMYQQLLDNYILHGQMASMDAMGQAASLTGGYGSSYGQAVGHQAYNQYLTELNSVVPELQSMAYDRYQQEGQDLLNKYSLYRDLSDQEYIKHQDSIDRWYQENAGTSTSGTSYGTLDTEAAFKWAQRFADAPSIADLETLTTMLETIIGPQAAAKWYNEYAKKFAGSVTP